jgi:tRNA modification GTPase
LSTIFALSSGTPPAAIAIVRVSGPDARSAVQALAGAVPPRRHARRSALHAANGDLLDDALVLWLPGPKSATGEDCAEFHLHGGRAVVAAVEAELATLPGLRRAQPGEFTRRAFGNGRLDLAEAEGLADLLFAETELQRQAALASAGGSLSRKVDDWRERVLHLSGQIEAMLNFDEEDEVAALLPPSLIQAIHAFEQEIEEALALPAAEALREGFRVALAGPPNAGKSTLFNALLGNEAAITAPIAGTTRDVLERPVALYGVPFTFVDMAGIRDDALDVVETIGITRARAELRRADLVLWLGPEGEGPVGAWEIEPQCDRPERIVKATPRFVLSAVTGNGVPELLEALVDVARATLPKPGDLALNSRQRSRLQDAAGALREATSTDDPLLVAEGLRACRAAFDALLGRTGTEEMLDAVFARFCIGK